MHANDIHELYDRHHKVSRLTLILFKTQIILSNMKSYEKEQKDLFYMKYPNSGLGAFLDISELVMIKI